MIRLTCSPVLYSLAGFAFFLSGFLRLTCSLILLKLARDTLHVNRLVDSPFYKMFERGLNVSLSTDDPLLFHLSESPLLEEYRRVVT